MSSLSRNFTIAVVVQPQTHKSQLDNLLSHMSQRGFNRISVTQGPEDHTTNLPPVDRLIFIPRRPEQFSSPTDLMNSLNILQNMPLVSSYEIKPGITGVPMNWQRSQRQLKAVA